MNCALCLHHWLCSHPEGSGRNELGHCMRLLQLNPIVGATAKQSVILTVHMV